MKTKIIKEIIRNRKRSMSFEIVLSREYFYPLDEDGKEKNVSTLNYRVRYCVKHEGSDKILKCFLTHEKAKKFVHEMKYEEEKANAKKNKKIAK
ncbi:hypothetical protein B9Z45_02090 [Limnohabitans sp. 2KL-17]|uniref:hypothetical protein n=1 Tax=Limnohabitans sp. 2KL-17 TaxID=1100704 RepID=UPI000D35D64A|nr:hypothetical protein [Limnohabitans sp. 2KL-17]PUE62877.1 hypothetical protein B9Z45_02090 [Limnohabitans sp. 2KL-17]